MHLKTRSFRRQDIPHLLNILSADHLPSQPQTRIQDVRAALTGRATIDRHWWKALTSIQTIVALQGQEILGAASFGKQKIDPTKRLQPDGSGCLLWLHAREEPAVIEALLLAVLTELNDCPRVYAFWFATPLTVGIEGLPMGHRLQTHQMLLQHHFIGKDAWLYMAGPVAAPSHEIASVKKNTRGWQLSVHEGQKLIAEAKVSLGQGCIGLLHWLWVREDRRGQGLGTRLFSQARNVLADAGAQTIVLFADHGSPDEYDRTAAIHLYQRHGFSVVDHLWSYWRGTPPSWITPL
jgi:GNAT superfamily N-acetyltransferase